METKNSFEQLIKAILNGNVLIDTDQFAHSGAFELTDTASKFFQVSLFHPSTVELKDEYRDFVTLTDSTKDQFLLYLICRWGKHIDVMKLLVSALLNSGANINAKNTLDKGTCLHGVAWSEFLKYTEKVEMIRFLRDLGALDIKNANGETPDMNLDYKHPNKREQAYATLHI